MVPDGVRVIDLDSRRTLTAVPRFLRYVRRERPVAMLSTLTASDVVALIAKLIHGGRLRVVVRQTSMFASQLTLTRFKVRQTMRLVRLLMPKADGLWLCPKEWRPTCGSRCRGPPAK